MTNVSQRVTALVVTYNRKDLLVECLNAIEAQTALVNRVVVIDNASTDGTSSLFEENGAFFGDSLIDYRRMSTNLGGAGGFNAGLKAAHEEGCDWVWLMDDDCIPYADTLQGLLSGVDVAFEDDGQAPSFMASSVYGPQGEPMNVPIVDRRPSSNGYADWYTSVQKGLVKIESATFVSLLINDKAIEELGLPVASFFIWGDDSEYTTRLTHHFGPAYLVGSSRVLHKRVNAKSLDIQNENDPKRIANFHNLYRNNLIVSRYHHGKKASAKAVIGNLLISAKCLAKGDGGFAAKRARCGAILAGTFEYLGRKYDLEDLGRIVNR